MVGIKTNPITSAQGDREFKPIGQVELELIDGLHGFVQSNVAVKQELGNMARELTITNNRLRQMGGGGIDYDAMSGAVAAGVAGVLGSFASQIITMQGDTNKTTEQIIAEAQPAPAAPPPPGTSASTVAAAAAISTAPATSASFTGPAKPGPGDRPGPADSADPMSNWEMYRAGRGVSLAGLRQSLGGTISQIQPGTGPYEQQANGRWINTETGHPMADDSPDLLRALRHQQTAGAVQGRVGHILEAQTIRAGLANALPSGVGRALGVAGAAYTVADTAAGKVIEQREANREWQAMSGESNFSGFAERGRGRMFQFGQRWQGVGEKDAQAMYSGVQALGLRGEDRGNALDFMSDQIRRTGMQVADSLRLVEISLANGNEGLVGLSGALDQVTGAAREAGLNANVVRKNFETMYEAMSPQFSTPGQAAALAAGVATTQAGLGRTLQDVGITGMFDQTNMRRQAQMAGMGFGEFVQQSAGPEGAMLRAAGAEAQITADAERALGPANVAQVRAFVEENSTNGKYDGLPEDSKAELSRMVIGMVPDPEVLMIWARFAGYQPGNYLDAAGMLAATVTQGMGITANVAKTQQSSNVRNLTKGERGTARALAQGRIATGQGRDAGIYARRQVETGKTSAIVDRLLGNDKDGPGYDKSRRYEVEALENGKLVKRQVDLGQGLESYAEQFERGTARIVAGRNEGSTVAEAVGLTTAENVKADPKEVKAGYRGGKNVGGDDRGAVNGTVTVQASPELRRFLTMIPSGAGVSVGAGGPGVTDPRNRPTGGT